MEPNIAKREHLPAQPCVFCGAHTSQFYLTVGKLLEDCVPACDDCVDAVAAARAAAQTRLKRLKV